MGQQDSKPQINNAASSRTNANHYQAPSMPSNSRTFNSRVECEGLLRLQTTPFKNSIEIDTGNQILFLQNIETTLKQLLQNRLNTNKLFTLEDMERLIETTTFTLAKLQEKQITYKDISPSNIFYDQGNFKLLPNELIQLTTYQQLQENGEAFPSPELIIALRCGEEDIIDDDILQKSNVFTLGMVLLEVATLLPSCQCYQSESKDILDFIISERIIIVEQCYGEMIAKIIANMLDYDYSERMNIRDMSIWINRQMATSRSIKSHSESASLHTILSRSERTVDIKSISDRGNSKVRQVKNNSVYLGGCSGNDRGREEKDNPYIEGQDNNSYYAHKISNKSHLAIKKDNPASQYVYKFDSDSIDHQDKFNFEYNKCLRLKQSTNKSNQSHPYQFSADYRLDVGNRKYFDRASFDRESITKKSTILARQYINDSSEETSECQGNRIPLKEIGNQHANESNFIKQKSLPMGIDIKKPRENGSLNRIKQEIIKSRKLIEELKRSEGQTQ